MYYIIKCIYGLIKISPEMEPEHWQINVICKRSRTLNMYGVQVIKSALKTVYE